MKHIRLKNCVWLAALGAAALLLASCRKEEDFAAPERPEFFGEKCAFSIAQEDPETDGQTTKSLLTDGSIESKVTSVTIGVYDSDGAVVDKQYFTTFSNMTFTLEHNTSYTAYALVNMGDMRSSLPATTATLSSVSYTIPAYTGSSESVNTRGIPMAGYLSFTTGSGSTEIPVKRLLAKVTASLSCDWAGARITSAKIYNMNKVLKPFGTSAATGASDMLTFQELQNASGTGSTSLSATFYVPENMQGTISGISSSENKAGDKNATVNSNSGKLTYLETTVETTGKYDGTIKYRSYLGSNATTNFDIQRNYRYAWTLHYNSSRVDDFSSDWKHYMPGVTVKDYSLSLSPNPQTVAVGGNFTYTTTLTENILYPTASSSGSTLSNGSVSWSSSAPGVATVSSEGVVTGVSQGSATITARYTPSGADFSERTASASVNVDLVTHSVEVTGVTYEADYQSTIYLTAKYYTFTNGVKDAGVDVSVNGGTTWAPATGNIVVTKGATYGQVTASNYGTAQVTASYNGYTSDPVTVTFNRTDRALILSHTPTNAKANQTIQMSAVLRTTTNGVESNTNIPAANVTWSVDNSSKSDPSANVSVSSAGVVSTDKAVSVNIQAVYNGVTPSLSAARTVEFSAVTSNYLQIVGSPLEVNVGTTINLSAKYHTVTDGVDDGGVNVTVSWTRKSGSTNISVNSSSGAVTASSYGSAVIEATYTNAQGTFTDEVTVVFHLTTHSLSITPAAPAAVNVGSKINLTATYYTFYDGVQQSANNVTLAAAATWSRLSGSSNISVTKGATYAEVSATAGGSATIKVEYGTESATVPVTFNDVIDYEIVVTPSSSTGCTYTSSASLTATWYKLTNGVRDGGTNVTSSASWSVSGGSKYSATAGTVSATPTAGSPSVAGTVTVTAQHTASGATRSTTATVTFVDVTTYGLVVTPSSQTANWAMGSTLASYVATYHTYTNGFSTNQQVVTTSGTCTWTVTDGTNFQVSGGEVQAKTTSASNTGVRASYGGYTSNQATLTVNPVTTYELEIVSSNGSFTAKDNETIHLTANYKTYVNTVLQSTTNVTSSASWTSSNAKVTSSYVNPYRNVVTSEHSADLTTATITATHNGKTASVNVSFTRAVTYTYELEVTPSSASGTYSSTVDFTAKFWTLANGVRTGSTDVTTSATWSCTGTKYSVGTHTGKVSANPTAGSPSVAGSTTVTATYSSSGTNYNDTATATFTDVMTYSLDVTPASGSGTASSPVAFTATYYTYTNGFQTGSSNVTSASGTAWTITGGKSNWSVSNGTVSATPTAGSPSVAGTGTVTATYSGKSDSSSVSFTDTMTYGLEVTPDSASGTYLAPASLTATYYTYTNGFTTASSVVTSSASWSCTTPSKYSVSAGTVSATPTVGSPSVAGSTTVTATYSGKSASATVNFTDVETSSLSVTPSSASGTYLSPVNLTATIHVYTNGFETDDHNVTSASGTSWSKTAGSVICSVSNGVVTVTPTVSDPSVAGTVTITATHSGKSASAQVTFTDVYTVEVTNGNRDVLTSPKVVVDGTRVFKAIYIQNGLRSIAPFVTASWSSSDTSKASITGTSADGATILGVATGTSTISATYNGKTGSVPLTVTAWSDDWDDPDDPEIDI